MIISKNKEKPYATVFKIENLSKLEMEVPQVHHFYKNSTVSLIYNDKNHNVFPLRLGQGKNVSSFLCFLILYCSRSCIKVTLKVK